MDTYIASGLHFKKHREECVLLRSTIYMYYIIIYIIFSNTLDGVS